MTTKKNSNLTAAKKAKQDEFYTRLYDIENELKYYKDQFKDKVVYCNCDNPSKSEFVRFFRLKFVDYGLKKLIATCITEDKSTGWAYVWDKDINGNGILDEEEVQMFPLKQNGDFRSDECIEYLKESDIVVTNPPFSLYRDFMAEIMKYEKKFLVIANDNSITYKEIFPYIKDGKLRVGKTKPKEFVQPDGTIKKFDNISWYTNLLVHKADNPMELVEKFDVKKYPTYDNYAAINVDKVNDIPYDYDGVMGVPITIIDKIADDGYIHFTHTGVDEIQIKGQILGHEHDLNEQHESVSQLTVQGGANTNESSSSLSNDRHASGRYEIHQQEKSLYESIDSKDIKYEIIWQACGNTRVSAPKELLDSLNYIQMSEDRGGCPVINKVRSYTRMLIQKVK